MSTTVMEIREMLRSADAAELEAIERSLASDTRKGVRAALSAARRRIAAEEGERARLEALSSFDQAQLDLVGGSVLVGLDEVGRGAVAGPLAVGAVALPRGCAIEGLDDSKKLTARQREIVAKTVRAHALAWAVYFVEPSDIDANGMSATLKRAFMGALSKIETGTLRADVVLIDGNPLGIDARERNIVKGDARSASIAAASVVAKVERDSLMCSLSSTFPHYGFSQNKGYASAGHIEAIRKFGISAVHRASFCRSFMQESLF